MTEPTAGDVPQDESHDLLRGADPASSLTPLDPVRVSALLEETMSQPLHEPTAPSSERSRWLLLGGVAAAAAVVAVVAVGLNGDGDETTAPVAVPTDAGSLTVLQAAPPVAAKCLAPTAAAAARQSLAFEGIVTEVADGVVTLRPTTFFTGPETSRVQIAEPDRGMSEAPPEFEVGASYIVGAVDGRVAICGLTGPATDGLRDLYEEAFGS